MIIHNRLHVNILVLFLVISFPAMSLGAGRSSIGSSSGISIPLGWWADRWDAGKIGEVNLRHEFTPGTGLLLLTGITKFQLTSMSDQEILDQSKLNSIEPEIYPYANVVNASQGGSFKQVSIGFGFYTERMLGRFRSYGSIAMIVYNYKFDRSQYLEIEIDVPEIGDGKYKRTDNWSDEKDGSEVGGQLAFGVVHQLSRLLLLDVSLAYNILSINQTNGALAYYGYPARTWTSEQIGQANGRTDFLQLRVGLRYGT